MPHTDTQPIPMVPASDPRLDPANPKYCIRFQREFYGLTDRIEADMARSRAILDTLLAKLDNQETA